MRPPQPPSIFQFGEASSVAGFSPPASVTPKDAAPSIFFSPPPSASNSALACFDLRLGAHVVLCGLLIKPELNGQQGILAGFDAKSRRCKVKLDDGRGPFSIKPENLLKNRPDETGHGKSDRRRSDVKREAPKQGSSGAAAVESNNSDLLRAAESGDDVTVTIVLRNPLVDPNMTDKSGNTPLLLAAARGHTLVVRLLRADERVNPNQTNEMGHTALMLGAIFGFTRVVRFCWPTTSAWTPTCPTKNRAPRHSPSPLRKGSCRS